MSLILVGSLLASSLNVFSRITSLIVNFWELVFKTSKVNFFPNALPSGEYVNLAYSIILL